jgi:hypothetical protein
MVTIRDGTMEHRLILTERICIRINRESADLSAYLILQMDMLHDLALKMGLKAKLNNGNSVRQTTGFDAEKPVEWQKVHYQGG